MTTKKVESSETKVSDEKSKLRVVDVKPVDGDASVKGASFDGGQESTKKSTVTAIARSPANMVVLEGVTMPEEYLKDPDRLRCRINRLKETIDNAYFELAELLYMVWNGGPEGKPLYLQWGFSSWNQYVEKELDFAIRKAQYLVTIWHWFGIEIGDKAIMEKVRPLGWCLPADAKIPVPAGEARIGDLRVGDKVLDANGKWTTIKDSVRFKEEEVYRLKVAKCGEIRITGHHSFPTIKDGVELFSQHGVEKSKRVPEEAIHYEVERVPAEKLSVGDYLIFPRMNPEQFDLGEFKGRPDSFFEFAGWYVAEGFVSGGKNNDCQVRITLGHGTEEQIRRLEGLARESFPECSVRTQIHEGYNRVTLSGGGVIGKFAEWFGTGPENKTFPDAFLAAPASAVKAFLRGLHLGDGSMSSRGGHLVATSSNGLAWKARYLLTRLNVLGGMSQIKDGSDGNLPMWAVTVSNSDWGLVFDGFNGEPEKPFCHYRKLKEGFAVPIRGVEVEEYDGEVVHIETESGMFCCPVASYNTKVKELVNVISQVNVDEWVEKAKKLSAAQLAEEAKAYLQARKEAEKTGTSVEKTEEVEKLATLSFKLFEGQLGTVNAALERAKELAHSDKKGHLLELICQDWLATNDAMRGDKKKNVASYLRKFEKLLGIRIVAIDTEAQEIICGQDVVKKFVAPKSAAAEDGAVN